MAGRLGLRHLIHAFDRDELFEAFPAVVRTMRSFDPMEVRNSVTIYIAPRTAKEEGVSTVMTGDGCDKLFAGYSYIFNLEAERLETELRKLWSIVGCPALGPIRRLFERRLLVRGCGCRVQRRRAAARHPELTAGR